MTLCDKVMEILKTLTDDKQKDYRTLKTALEMRYSEHEKKDCS